MTHFNENFCTDDFDQEMIDFITDTLKMRCTGNDPVTPPDLSSTYLKYSRGLNFWTSNNPDPVEEYLTKEQFKEKIGMTTCKPDCEDNTLTQLEVGKTYVFKDEESKGRYLGLHSMNESLVEDWYKDGFTIHSVDEYNQGYSKGDTIVISIEEITLFKLKEDSNVDVPVFNSTEEFNRGLEQKTAPVSTSLLHPILQEFSKMDDFYIYVSKEGYISLSWLENDYILKDEDDLLNFKTAYDILSELLINEEE